MAKTRTVFDSIKLSDGRTMLLYMPTTGDLLDAGNKAPIEVLIEIALGITYAEFRELPIIDGGIIFAKVKPLLEAVVAANGSTPDFSIGKKLN